MAEFKLTISNPKSGKTVQREAKADDAKPFVGKKIGDEINGEVINLTGYEFEITGGSDYCGFPMRKDAKGTGRKKILDVISVGIKKSKGKGIRQRKTVCGNTINTKIVQINLKVLKEGKENIFTGKEEGKQEEKKEEKQEKPKEEKPAEKPKEEKEVKEEPKKEKKEEKPEEPKKEETPKESKEEENQ